MYHTAQRNYSEIPELVDEAVRISIKFHRVCKVVYGQYLCVSENEIILHSLGRP